MNILFITARPPYPPLKGDQVRGYHQIRLLSRLHKITLLTFADNLISSQENLEQMEPYCNKIVAIPHGPFDMIFNVLRGVLSKYPLQTLIYQSPAMRKEIWHQLQTGSFDLVHIQLARLAPYLQDITNTPCVIDLIDALSVNMERRYRREWGLMRWVAWFEWQRMQAYEKFICCHCKYATIVSKADRDAIGDFANLYINPIGVDMEKFPFAAVASENRKTNHIIFSGNMSYFPNLDAVRWFVQEVLPIVKNVIPDVCFDIVGVNPHASLYKLAEEDSSVRVIGYVENLAEYLSSAMIAVVPIQSGSGMQFKVIEAMACGTPVIATKFALGGITVSHGEHLYIANTPKEFARSVIELLQDFQKRERMSLNSRKLVEQNYSWEQSVNSLNAIYEMATHPR